MQLFDIGQDAEMKEIENAVAILKKRDRDGNGVLTPDDSIHQSICDTGKLREQHCRKQMKNKDSITLVYDLADGTYLNARPMACKLIVC